MRMLWCRRCKAEVPMLNEAEYASVRDLYRQAMKGTREYRQRWGIPLKDATTEERFRPVCLHYEELTGYKETNPNAIMHHRLSLYGPPCKRCGKPLRTPKAKLCGACMHPVAPNKSD